MDDYFNLLGQASDEMSLEWLKNDKNRLLAELYIAEKQARKGGKRKTYDTHCFEANLIENLEILRDALWDYTYRPSRGTAHIIFNPVQREIFAAPYVDRIVHHEIVNSIIDWWEPRLHSGSCSCRIGKGTSYGIELLRHHIASVSENYTRPCYIVKMDISGYFMHIKKDILFQRMLWGLDRQFVNNKNKRYEVLKHAIYEVVFDDPIRDVKIQGSYEDWRGLPEDKSLFWQPPNQGMVIGNLTSQFCSNVYLDPLDRFITNTIGYKYYVRYVDDFLFVITEEQLAGIKKDIKVIDNFLHGIGLSINTKKTRVIPSWQGVPFLGMVVKDRLVLPGKRISRNFAYSAKAVVSGLKDPETIVSYLGMLNHYKSKRLNNKIFNDVGWNYNF